MRKSDLHSACLLSEVKTAEATALHIGSHALITIL
jgi:hypothetical protein